MKKSYTLHAILFAFFFTACSEPSSTSTGEDGESLIQTQSAIANGPSSETIEVMSPGEMTGTYTGVMPCGDCDGIKTSLSLKEDDTFILDREYIGKEATNLQVVGTYNYDDQSQMITLENVADGPSKFLILNGEIWLLDVNSNRMQGDLADHYVLTKNFE
jgi:uncharacterized lipoprotein NlpE involved in copper resistance